MPTSSWTFTFIGSQTTFVVPGGVTLLQGECWGAQGQTADDPGGKGGYVKGTFPVTPGETLYINAGGQSGFNGGGASGGDGGKGGGMSDVRQGGSGTGNIVLVGGGGGGAADDVGGAGGNPGLIGTGNRGAFRGGGATQSAGGAAGTGATAGSAFTGGAGAASDGSGGGGGYYGGGGSANAPAGGGSSWAGATAFNVSYQTGIQASNGVVKFTIPAPAAPTLITPVSGSTVDASTSVTFDWTYNQSAAGTTQLSYQFREKIGAGVYHYWNGTNLSSTTPVNNTTASTIATVTGLANGNTYNWSIAVTDSNGLGPFASDFTFLANNPPTISVTAPTGTFTTDPSAHIAWTPTTPAGQQIAYRAVVYTAAQYGAGGFAPGVGPSAWDSGTVGGGATSKISTPLVNATYRAYVQITQTGGQTVWGFSGFTISTTPPTTPTLGAASDPSQAVTTLTVFATAGTIATIQYNDDGVTWLPARNGTSIVVGGGNYVSIYDYEAPPAATRNYRAMVSTTLLVPSAWSATVPVTTISPAFFWLKDPLIFGSGIPLRVSSGTFITHYPEFLTEHQALGRADAIIRADVVGLEDGACTVWTMSPTDESTLMALLIAQKTLLLQSPDGRQWYIRITSARTTDASLGMASQVRTHAFSWRGQQRPA